MSSALEFEEYLSPNPGTVFSHHYFASLTFERTIELKFSYPTILPKGSVTAWAFSNEIHTTLSATSIQPGETVPHYEDIRGIIDQMPEAFALMARSVCLTLLVPDRKDPCVIHYHFLKACH
jgi:hypothetical protein